MSSGNAKVVVTGGAGFIGSHLCALLAREHEVHVIDNLRSGNRANLIGIPHVLHEGTIGDRALLTDVMHGARYVFHLAAMVSVPESMEQPVECVRTNTIGTLDVLEAAANAGVEKLVLSSTAAIYGDDPTLPKRETMAPCPKSPYAVTKLDGEYYCRMFSDTGRLATACLRYFNVFGSRQNPRSAYAAAVPKFLHKALAGEPIVIHGDGGQTRDFVHVSDVARANLHVARTAAATGVYNVANGGSLSILDLARRIVAITGSRSEIVHGPERPGDIRHSTADPSALASVGFRCDGDFDRLLAETVDAMTAPNAA
ncbi:MAG: NAD-dependent epimerase/dehydratase family protein [Armatimonadota bacterium]